MIDLSARHANGQRPYGRKRLPVFLNISPLYASNCIYMRREATSALHRLKPCKQMAASSLAHGPHAKLKEYGTDCSRVHRDLAHSGHIDALASGADIMT